jgi:NADH:ubiquinone reductase (H+-translocating)
VSITARRTLTPLRSTARARTVLLGCSFAGLEFLHHYARRAGLFAPGEMTVVDPRGKHSYIPLAHEVASGARTPDEMLFETPAFVAAVHGEWIMSGAKSIDPARKTVTLENGRTLAYDRCIIAVGSVPDLPVELDGAGGVIGAKWVSDALALYQRLRVLRATGARMMRVVVAGGGLTAVEWSAELATARVEGTRIAVTLIGAAPRLLPAHDPHIARRAGRLLESLNVEMVFGRRVAGFGAGRATIADGAAFPGDVLLWAGGVRANPVLADFGVPLGDDGRVIVTPRLNVPGCDGLYAIGDAAQIRDGNDAWPTMLRAIEAIWQGATLARRFARGDADDAGPAHRLRTDFWYGISLGAKQGAIMRGARISERPVYVSARRWLQWAYYRRFKGD